MKGQGRPAGPVCASPGRPLTHQLWFPGAWGSPEGGSALGRGPAGLPRWDPAHVRGFLSTWDCCPPSLWTQGREEAPGPAGFVAWPAHREGAGGQEPLTGSAEGGRRSDVASGRRRLEAEDWAAGVWKRRGLVEAGEWGGCGPRVGSLGSTPAPPRLCADGASPCTLLFARKMKVRSELGQKQNPPRLCLDAPA